MSLGRVVVLVLMCLNYGLDIWFNIQKAKRHEGNTKDLFVKSVWSFVICLFFIYGFAVYEQPFIPGLIKSGYSGTFWVMFSIVAVVSLIINLLIGVFLSKKILKHFTEEERRDVALSNKPLNALVATLFISAKAGISEEFIFRFVFPVILSPFATMTVSWLGLSQLLGYVPTWLTLGFGGLVTPGIFLTAILLNIFFAILHKYGTVETNHWHRVIGAWFGGWICFLALVNFGLLGAILIHTLLDVLVIGPFLYLIFIKIDKEYWKSRYSFAE